MIRFRENAHEIIFFTRKIYKWKLFLNEQGKNFVDMRNKVHKHCLGMNQSILLIGALEKPDYIVSISVIFFYSGDEDTQTLGIGQKISISSQSFLRVI